MPWRSTGSNQLAMESNTPDASTADGLGEAIELIRARWPAPPQVQAISTTRRGGCSRPPYAGLNLADHVGDRRQDVETNRDWLRQHLHLSRQPAWLRQVHGTRVTEVTGRSDAPEADGSVTDCRGVVCAVLTADCMPILLCDREGRRVAALHVGWRGLSAGIIESGIRAMGLAPEQLMAWLGPAIGPQAFEVGTEVRDIFLSRDRQAARAFRPSESDRWFADIRALARWELRNQGVTAVYDRSECTYSDPKRFYSYRRDKTTGRMASLIWIEENA